MHHLAEKSLHSASQRSNIHTFIFFLEKLRICFPKKADGIKFYLPNILDCVTSRALTLKESTVF